MVGKSSCTDLYLQHQKNIEKNKNPGNKMGQFIRHLLYKPSNPSSTPRTCIKVEEQN